MDEDHCRQGGDHEPSEDCGGTVLERVLSSLCSNHRLLLGRILQDLREDYRVSLAQREAHRRLSKAEPPFCHTGRRPPDEPSTFPADTCTHLAGCLTTCRLRKCAVGSVCLCTKALTNLSCQNVALGCVGRVSCPSCTVCFVHHKIHACQHQHNGDDACNTRGVKKLHISVIHSPVHHSQDAWAGDHSPSPPPLSPVLVDMDCKMSDRDLGCHGEERSTPPPPLLPHRAETEDEAQHSHTVSGEAPCPATVKESQTSEARAKNDDDDGHQCGALIGDFMDKFTEKLKAIQPPERDRSPSSHTVQNSKVCDTHLTEIITTVLHNSSNKDYNLEELFEKHVAKEQQSPQTRSRKKQEVVVPASRREPSWFDSSGCRKNLVYEKSKYPKNIKPDLSSMWSVEGQSSVPEQISKTVEMVPSQDLSDCQNSSSVGSPVCKATSENPGHEEKEEPLQTTNQQEPSPLNKMDFPQSNVCHRKTIADGLQVKSKTYKKNGKENGIVERSRRNIVPPQRFSSYVTEPRKMYYAACFSENIFINRPSKVNGTSKHGSEGAFCTSIEADDENPIKTETFILCPWRQEKKTFALSMGEDQIGINSNLKRSPRTRTKSPESSTPPTKRLKCCGIESQLSMSALHESVDSNDFKDTMKTSIKYSSPIKLMLVSPVKSEDGVKYTLKAADCGSHPHREMFDPCVEASWAGNVVNDTKEYLQTGSMQSAEFESISSKLPKETESCDEGDLDDHSNSTGRIFPAMHETTPVKRRPGRPKKLGPHIEKAVKRPIGRPPKPKAGDISNLNGKNVNRRTNELSRGEDGNKNLKITIMYGRSRKARRLVSEDLGLLSTDQHVYDGESNGTNKTHPRWMNTGEDSVFAAKDQLEDLNLVTPCLEDKKGIVHSSSNIKCQKQNDMAVTRKPGRPPKVKISGISVTVTTVSPRQRKIHMRRDVKESPLRRALVMECELSKEQKTINQQPDDDLRAGAEIMKQDTEHSPVSFVPVRHSVRERKPSIHLLHSVATARSFTPSNALVQRSHKLLMNNPTKTRRLTLGEPKVATNNILSNKRSTVGCMQDAARFSGVSVDSIFASNEGLKWWPISASPETLNEELARRIRLMSDTWVSDALETNASEEIKTNQTKSCEKNTSSAERSPSAVRMLFGKNYNMEKLCSWFMQTTETQSLAIVKKVSARNPYEVFHYNPIRPTCSMNVCRSPQAERLRKHVKKFAKVVPKSPARYRQAQAGMYNIRRSLAKTYPFTTSKVFLMPGEEQKTSMSCGTWRVYRTALLRARMKFKARAKKNLANKVGDEVYGNQMGSSVEKTSVLKEVLSSLNEEQDASKFTESKSIEVEASKRTVHIDAISREERISYKAWSAETLKECRVFLKKINSPNTKLMTEECNICTVKFNISPAGCDIAMEQEEKKSSEVKFEKTCSSLRKPSLSATNQSAATKLGGKRGSCFRGESPPAKLARQSRSSRGVLGARWCDFVLELSCWESQRSEREHGTLRPKDFGTCKCNE